MPAEKHAQANTSDREDAFDLPNICFMGANVVSGYATGVILQTGATTFFGQLAHEIAGRRVPTAFDRGKVCYAYDLRCRQRVGFCTFNGVECHEQWRQTGASGDSQAYS
jgi:Mg2+-importing ATPase